MDIKENRKQPDEQLQVAKFIFKGMTISQMAKSLCCAQSTISYHINLLYSKYKVKSRHDFILKVFGEIIENYKRMIEIKNNKISNLEREMDEIKNILNLLSDNRNDPSIFDYWAQEAKKYIL